VVEPPPPPPELELELGLGLDVEVETLNEELLELEAPRELFANKGH